jgi:hypothetical protein
MSQILHTLTLLSICMSIILTEACQVRFFVFVGEHCFFFLTLGSVLQFFLLLLPIVLMNG